MELHLLMRLLAYGAEEAIENSEPEDIPYGEKTIVIRVDNKFYDLTPDIMVTENCVVLEAENGTDQDGQYTH